ncbi:DUF2924 domain-containing protein [Altererythrobacter sp. Root672]|uniref:DUF2924 domain-containing protein n=1 Tax=Altererythrobacter sp. Root672 TaxID=1736584 RepID=UPI0006FDD1A7|nr:DUF2924 domain-containing protein [Altererythrobacter sp. Root672]KRA79740.1 hypothetical protein ASD76_17115 [Altererythrobacter sp. Root672]
METATLDEDLAALAALSSVQLRRRWSELTGKPVPRVSPSLLRLALAWELQAKVHGGLARRVSQRLDQLAAAKTQTRAVRPGMRLTREWNGSLYVVTVEEHGSVNWNGRQWASLSKVAREITGTRWSGPAFFGLKHKRKAA